MPRNLVVCCDGTSNEFGSENTNVVRLVQAMDGDPAKQFVYYDPGVGTLPEPGYVTSLGRKWSEVLGLAFGRGLTEKVAAAYQFLMDWYEPGDRIYLFGFSRGAYTVRALAGVIHQFGLLRHGTYNLVPYVMKMSRAIEDLDRDDEAAKQRYWDVCREFGETFSRPGATSGFGPSPLRIRFVGVWDTVSSVGWAWDPQHFAYTRRNPSIEVLRHAISIDERRAFFRQNLFRRSPPPPAQDVRELWFPGCHCDVGGGNPSLRSGLWQEPFRWIVQEARDAGLVVVDAELAKVLAPPDGAPPGWKDALVDSLRWFWVPAEFFPKPGRRNRSGWRRFLPINCFKRRTVRDGELIGRAALERIRRPDLGYRPPNLSDAFLDRVRGLPAVPDHLAYSET